MALNCEEKLAADIEKDCDNKPVGGIEVNAVLINFEDIDKATSTLDVTNDIIITNLATKSGTSGFFVEGNSFSLSEIKTQNYDLKTTLTIN